MIHQEFQMTPVPKTVVIGADSFIGKRLLEEYRKLNSNPVGTARHPVSENLIHFDLLETDINSLKLSDTGHKAAIICAGVTGIDRCEKEKVSTRKINVDSTLKHFFALSDQEILPIFLSSDSVFDGNKEEFYTEKDPLRPITEYGRQKAQVETEVRNSRRPHLIIRLSKVFGTKMGDGTFLTEAAYKLKKGEKVLAAADLVFNPVWIEDAVRAIILIQARQLQGVVHVCSPEVWSRYNLMSALAENLKCEISLVEKITLNDLKDPILPKNLSMSCKKLQDETGISFMPMASCLDAICREYNPVPEGIARH